MEAQKLLKTDREGKPKRPVRFIGQLIAMGDDKDSPRTLSNGTQDKHEGKWDEVRVYEEEGGSYLVGIAHKTEWHGEHDVKLVHECRDLKRVMERVRSGAPYVAGLIEHQLNGGLSNE